MAWMELIIAGILEVFWSTMMKWSDGFSKINYSFYTVIGMIGFESIPRTRFVRIFSRFQRVSISSFRPAVKPKPFDR